ncbi:polycystic kidney disease protein 1-like 2 [Chiloscyllium plagiosum]|uniref:polycystic kidney disease protein 1-like 2 n=1 Tax=Chiloscyllium plagiosum TaxID=36176 RepID=UPI001CB87A44|nr:polycystic kidney disease protein 1-like 2 [Chiloscyllium plagiosum]
MPCLEHQKEFQNSCYEFMEQRLNFGDAQNWCKQGGGHLTNIQNENMHNFLQNHINHIPDNTRWWIGLVLLGAEPSRRLHVPVLSWLGASLQLPNAGISEQGTGLSPKCGYLSWKSRYKHWDTTSCSKTLSFICEFGLQLSQGVTSSSWNILTISSERSHYTPFKIICSVDTGDGRMINTEIPEQSFRILHTYRRSGLFQIHVECHSKNSHLEAEKAVFIQELSNDFSDVQCSSSGQSDVIPTCRVPFGRTLLIDVATGKGVHLIYTASIGNITLYTSTAQSGIISVDNATQHLIGPGVHQTTIHVLNNLTLKETSWDITIHLMEPLVGLETTLSSIILIPLNHFPVRITILDGSPVRRQFEEFPVNITVNATARQSKAKDKYWSILMNSKGPIMKKHRLTRLKRNGSKEKNKDSKEVDREKNGNGAKKENNNNEGNKENNSKEGNRDSNSKEGNKENNSKEGNKENNSKEGNRDSNSKEGNKENNSKENGFLFWTLKLTFKKVTEELMVNFSYAVKSVDNLVKLEQAAVFLDHLTSIRSNLTYTIQVKASEVLMFLCTQLIELQAKGDNSSERIGSAANSLFHAADNLVDAMDIANITKMMMRIANSTIQSLEKIQTVLLTTIKEGDKPIIKQGQKVNMYLSRIRSSNLAGSKISTPEPVHAYFTFPSKRALKNIIERHPVIQIKELVLILQQEKKLSVGFSNLNCVYELAVDLYTIPSFRNGNVNWIFLYLVNGQGQGSVAAAEEGKETKGPGMQESSTLQLSRFGVLLVCMDESERYRVGVLTATALLKAIQVVLFRDNVSKMFMKEYRSCGDRMSMELNVTSHEESIVIQINSEEHCSLQLFLGFQYIPSETMFQLQTVLPIMSANGDRICTWILTPRMLQHGEGVYYVTIGPSNTSQAEITSYNVSVFTAQCLFWTGDKWSDNLCQVGPQTTPGQSHCLCNHLTFFGSTFFVMPNTLDLTQIPELFAQTSQNPVVVSLVATIFGVYIIVLVWARVKDRSDLRKAKVTVLFDNDPHAQYRYLIRIQTGHRKGAATTAKVVIMLIGSKGQSDPHFLTDSEKPVFERGAVDEFLLTTFFSLGTLQSIRLWHDNSGSSPSWYVNHVTVLDVEANKQWHFICNSWLAIDIDENMIDKIFLTASDMELKSFKNVFFTKTAESLTDGHIWFSVVERPPRSLFTRVQRVSCCFSLLLGSMLTNIMFWGTSPDESAQAATLGNFSSFIQELMIGIESALIMFPINLGIVQIFRSIRHQPNKTNILENASIQKSASTLHAHNPESLVQDIKKMISFISRSLSDGVPTLEEEVNNTSDINQTLALLANFIHISVEQHNMIENINTTVNTEENPPGLRSQKLKQQQHRLYMLLEQLEENLNQMGISTFQNPYSQIHAVDQVQKMMCFLRSSSQFNDTIYERNTTTDSKDLNRVSVDPNHQQDKTRQQRFNGFPWWFVYIAWFLVIVTSATSAFFTILYGLSYGKSKSIKWLISMATSLFQTTALILFLLLYETINVTKFAFAKIHLLFISLLLTVAYGEQNSNSFYLNRAINQAFTPSFNDIQSIEDFYTWTSKLLLPKLYGSYKGFITDGYSKLLGSPRIRQLRVKNIDCPAMKMLKSLVKHCAVPYSFDEEDMSNYGEQWSNNTSDYASNLSYIWQYQPRLQGYSFWRNIAVYRGSGYVADLTTEKENASRIVEYLIESNWIDSHTRAIFVEFTVYNANVNLFCATTLTLETNGIVMERDRFVSFHGLMSVNSAFTYIIAVLVALTTIKLWYLLQLDPKLHLFTSAMQRAWGSLRGLFVVLILLLVAYASVTYVIMGLNLSSYSTFFKAATTVFLLQLGSFNYNEVLEHYPISGAIIIASSTICMTFVILNLFLSVILLTFTEERNSPMPSEDQEIVDLLLKKLCGFFGNQGSTKSLQQRKSD